jgi:hypothetical protein
MAGRAEMTALTRKGQQIFMPAIATPHTGKPEMQIPAVQIPVYHVPDIGPEKPVLPLIAIVPGHFQVFEMILDTLEVIGLPRVARLIDVKGFSGGTGIEHRGSPLSWDSLSDTDVNINEKYQYINMLCYGEFLMQEIER